MLLYFVDRVVFSIEQLIDSFTVGQPELVHIYSGVVASNECERDLLEAKSVVGKSVFLEKVSTNPKFFHGTLEKTQSEGLFVKNKRS